MTVLTLCFSILVCADTTSTAYRYSYNIRLPEQLSLMIQACDAPCILERVVGTKRAPSLKKYAQDQCFDIGQSKQGGNEQLH